MKKLLQILALMLYFHNCSSDLMINYEVVNLQSAIEQISSTGFSGEKIFQFKSETNLSESEILLLKKLLAASIATYNKNHETSSIIELSDYKIYFIPTIDNENQKWVFVYGNCKEYPEINGGGLASFFLVDDGGSCYFQTVINLTKKTEGWIVINSRA